MKKFFLGLGVLLLVAVLCFKFTIVNASADQRKTDNIQFELDQAAALSSDCMYTIGGLTVCVCFPTTSRCDSGLLVERCDYGCGDCDPSDQTQCSEVCNVA